MLSTIVSHSFSLFKSIDYLPFYVLELVNVDFIKTGSHNVKKNSGRHCFLLHLCVSGVVFFTKKLGKNDAKGLAVDVGGGEFHFYFYF